MRQGFTLLELSIVLVIIGLIVGGVVAGQSLVKGAELGKVVADVNRFKAAGEAFRIKYDYYPGDLPTAQTYWPSCVDEASNTCNGNGSGLVGDLGYEHFRFWQHLDLSGIFPTGLTGMTVSPGLYKYGTNLPSSPRSGGFMPYPTSWTGAVTFTDQAFYWAGMMKLVATIDIPAKGLLTVEEAMAFDKKYDDGQPYSGAIFDLNGRDDGNVAQTGCIAAGMVWQPPSSSVHCTVFFNWFKR